MTDTALAPMHLTSSEIDLIKRTVAQGATDDELKLFLYDCRRQGVHPLDKMIHFSKRGGKYTPITSIDHMRSRADETGAYAGSDEPAYDIDDESDKLPRWSRVTVWKIVQGVRCPFTATARWSEYAPRGNEGFMWQKMPRLMLGKCAEALALRKAFPKQLHGIYERAEMMQAQEPAADAKGSGTKGESPQASAHSHPVGSTPSTVAPVESSPGSLDQEPPFNDQAADEERKELERRISAQPPARVTILMRRLELGDGDWRKLDIAALNMLANHLDKRA